MKFKLDENLPEDLADLLGSFGQDVATAAKENLSGADDLVILKEAIAEGRLFLTLDLGFADIRKFPVGSHSGIVVFRLHDQRWSAMKKPVERLMKSGLLAQLKQGLAIVDETRIRFRLPRESGE